MLQWPLCSAVAIKFSAPGVPRELYCENVLFTGPLSTETEAVLKYKSSRGEGLEPCLKLLQQAAADKSVAAELVEGALAYLEQNHGRRC